MSTQDKCYKLLKRFKKFIREEDWINNLQSVSFVGGKLTIENENIYLLL